MAPEEVEDRGEAGVFNKPDLRSGLTPLDWSKGQGYMQEAEIHEISVDKRLKECGGESI